MNALPILLPALLTAFAILGIQAAFAEGMIFGFIPAWVERRITKKSMRLMLEKNKAESASMENPHDLGLKEIFLTLNERSVFFDKKYWSHPEDDNPDNYAFIPPSWTKPLWGCNVCMSSVYGLAGFAVFHPAPWVYVLAFIPIVAGIMVAYNELTGE